MQTDDECSKIDEANEAFPLRCLFEHLLLKFGDLIFGAERPADKSSWAFALSPQVDWVVIRE
jgi:hypothetical protein